MDNIEIGKRIKKIRLSKNLNIEQFAKLINIQGQGLGAIEKGKAGISREKLVNICLQTGISADYILFGKIENINLLKQVNSITSSYSIKDLKIAIEIIESLSKIR